MAKKTLSGSITLTKLVHVAFEVDSSKEKGKKVKGIFIPIEPNYLVVGKEKEGKTPLYLPVNIIMHEERNENGQDGMISQQGNVKWKEATDEQKEIFNKLPILGNVIDWSRGNHDENSGAASTETFTPQSNDLPF